MRGVHSLLCPEGRKNIIRNMLISQVIKVFKAQAVIIYKLVPKRV